MHYTDLALLRSCPSKFTWGRIKKFHDIGPYTIVETSTNFHVYVDGQDVHRATETLDQALIFAVASKNLGNPNDAAHMAAACDKILDLNSVPLKHTSIK